MVDGCVGIPQEIVYSGLCFLFVGGVICLLFANFISRTIGTIMGYTDDDGLNAMTGYIRFCGFASFVALACFFVFMYPNQQTTPAGCPIVITPFGGQ